MLAPARQGHRNLSRVIRLVVDAGNTRAVAAVMVQTRFDDVRRGAEIDQAGSDAPSEIVQAPRPDHAVDPAIQLHLGVSPPGESATGAIAKQAIAVRFRLRLDD